MSLKMAHKVILPPKKNYIPQFLKQRDINSYFLLMQIIFNVGQVASISPGGRHTLMLTSRGEVFTCGSNDFGQLGREGSQTRLEQV
jgi:alpha-tubulin suppressor-like RCC1 family protein